MRRRRVDEPTLERLTELRLDDDNTTLSNRKGNTLTSQSTTRLVDSVLCNENVAREQFAHSVARKTWHARIALWWNLDARQSVAAAFVASIILARAVWRTSAVEARVAVAAAHAATIATRSVADVARIIL